jgi:hypothetical protein
LAFGDQERGVEMAGDRPRHHGRGVVVMPLEVL